MTDNNKESHAEYMAARVVRAAAVGASAARATAAGRAARAEARAVRAEDRDTERAAADPVPEGKTG